MDRQQQPTQKQIRDAIQAHNVNVPIYQARIVGGRLELSLYGGRVVYHPARPITTPPEIIELRNAREYADLPHNEAILKNPHLFNRKELRTLAAGLDIKGAKSMNKGPLLKAIKEWKAGNAWLPPPDLE
jgi:hypothetical protein